MVSKMDDQSDQQEVRLEEDLRSAGTKFDGIVTYEGTGVTHMEVTDDDNLLIRIASTDGQKEITTIMRQPMAREVIRMLNMHFEEGGE